MNTEMIKQIVKRILSPFFYLFHNRTVGAKMECRFWDKYLGNNGWRYQDEFKKRISTDAAVEGYHKEVLDKIWFPGITILDVGAGPITAILAQYKGHPLNIKACDPLGDHYQSMLKKYGITPRVVTESVAGEELSKHFRKKFHWINCQNALDHAEHPNLVIDEMINLLEEHGTLTLYHEINEGLNEGYRGFHKWNIAPMENQANAFRIYSPNKSFIYSNIYKGCYIHTEVRKQWLFCNLSLK